MSGNRLWLPGRRLWLPRRRWARPAGPSACDRMAPINRRTVLRGLFQGTAVALALPWLESMTGGGMARACGGMIPKRFGVFIWGNGNLIDHWTPEGEGEGDEWELSEQLEPLADFKDLITVITGMSVKVPNDDPHVSGAVGFLGAAPATYVGSDATFTDASIDQVIAEEIGNDTLYKSIQTGATDVSGLSYTGPNSKNPPETDPYAFYERLFGDTFREPGEKGVVDPGLGLRRSVLDSVMEDIMALQNRVSTADQARLDQHLTGVRELEQRLAQLEEDPPNLEACSRPEEPGDSYPDEDGRPQIAARNEVMSQMVAMALACDQTRVFGHYFTDPLTDVLFPEATAGHHDLTHNESDPQEEVNAITIQCMEGLATLLGALASVPEEDGTLLDNCALLATSDVSDGQTHSIDEMPIVLAGECCGALKTGMHYRSTSQENTTKVLITLLRAMDILVEDHGTEEAWTDESLSAVEV